MLAPLCLTALGSRPTSPAVMCMGGATRRAPPGHARLLRSRYDRTGVSARPLAYEQAPIRQCRGGVIHVPRPHQHETHAPKRALAPLVASLQLAQAPVQIVI